MKFVYLICETCPDLQCFSSRVSDKKYSNTTGGCHFRRKWTVICYKITSFVRLNSSKNCLVEHRVFFEVTQIKAELCTERNAMAAPTPTPAGLVRADRQRVLWVGDMAGPVGQDPCKTLGQE